MALTCMTVLTFPASAGPFFRIVDNNGNTIAQPKANYPYPQASFRVDGCSLILSGTIYVRICQNGLNSVETQIVSARRGCGSENNYPFAEIDSDPAFAGCYWQAVNAATAGCCGPVGSGAYLTYHMTAAPTAPGGMTFKRWVVHYYTVSAGADPFSGPTTPCQEGDSSLSCTVTIPPDANEIIPYPVLIYSPMNFDGFLAPVNSTDVNVVKGGSAVPIQFSLGGDFGISILAANSPAFQPTDCNSSLPTSSLIDTVTAGGSSLSYDATSNTYTYVWKTNKAWSGSCGLFVLGLNDGTSYSAKFQFR
jgi:hypothetical protein